VYVAGEVGCPSRNRRLRLRSSVHHPSVTRGEEDENGNPRDTGVSFPYELESNQGREEIIDAGCKEVFLSRWRFYSVDIREPW
jgi:hypothetical protein